jgi:hypothetical protein
MGSLDRARARGLTVVAVALGASAAWACGSTDFSRQGDGGVDASVEGQVPPADGGPQDAPLDAPADGGPAVFDRWSPCDSDAHALCDDFDQNGGALAPMWTLATAGGGSVTRIFFKSVSAPGSLQVEVPGRPTAFSPENTVRATITARSSRIRCTFDFFVDVRSASDTAQILRIQAEQGPDSGFASFAADLRLGQQLQLAVFGAHADAGPDAGPYMQVLPAVPIAAQQWQRLTVDFTTASTAGTGTVSIQVAGGGAQSANITPPAEPSQTVVRVGLDALSSGSAAWRVYYDNFFCDRTP